MPSLGAHIAACETCSAALAAHDEAAPACGDTACQRIALCEAGVELRDAYLFPAG